MKPFGEWGIKLIQNIKQRFQVAPLRTHSKYISFSLFIALIILVIIQRFLITDIAMSIIHGSTTLTMLHYSVMRFLGDPLYYLLMGGSFLLLYVFLVYVVWTMFLHRHERIQKEVHLQQLFTDVLSVARGSKDNITTKERSFMNVADAVNTIVQNAQQAMEDERHMEQTKNELITNVSHDMRTPLTSIIGYLSIIEEDKYRDEVELRRYTQIVFEKALQMDKLIHELFEYTRMQDRNYSIERHDVNLQEMISQLLIHHALLIDSSGMIIREENKTTEALIKGDGEKLARMFDNLLINAIKHGQDGTYIDIRMESDKAAVVLSITNYGEPIPTIDLPYLFDRFYRADKARTHPGTGSGLGLAIVKSIVELHGGTIDVTSSYEGTTFTIHLPRMIRS